MGRERRRRSEAPCGRIAPILVQCSGMAGGEIQDLRAVLGSLPGDRFRFLSADRRRAYAAVLWLLLRHRRAHRIEVYFDDLMVESMNVVQSVEPGEYGADAFRADIAQLEEWGNLAPRRLEPRRIETLADRHLRKFLCRLDDDTAAILEFLEGRSRIDAAALSGHGSHFLRDAADRLHEAQRLATALRKRIPDVSPSAAEEDETTDPEEGREESRSGGAAGSPEETDPREVRDLALRFAYLCAEADRKVDDAARELSSFDAALVAGIAGWAGGRRGQAVSRPPARTPPVPDRGRSRPADGPRASTPSRPAPSPPLP